MLEDDALDVFSEVLEELEDGPGFGCTSPACSINAQSHASTVKVNKRFIPWMVNSQLQIYIFLEQCDSTCCLLPDVKKS